MRQYQLSGSVAQGEITVFDGRDESGAGARRWYDSVGKLCGATGPLLLKNVTIVGNVEPAPPVACSMLLAWYSPQRPESAGFIPPSQYIAHLRWDTPAGASSGTDAAGGLWTGLDYWLPPEVGLVATPLAAPVGTSYTVNVTLVDVGR